MFVIGIILVVCSIVAICHSLWASLMEGQPIRGLIRQNWADIVMFGSFSIAGFAMVVGDVLISLASN